MDSNEGEVVVVVGGDAHEELTEPKVVSTMILSKQSTTKIETTNEQSQLHENAVAEQEDVEDGHKALKIEETPDRSG